MCSFFYDPFHSFSYLFNVVFFNLFTLPVLYSGTWIILTNTHTFIRASIVLFSANFHAIQFSVWEYAKE